ncbi:DgyrCDS7388 [Dimorphilus gyrociliatus]|uniref:DgyrCDS7388 n=1 Tax=Dimorphilus gyrociliatus TaxID=2664684 RepID=A0A7I8VQX3_9ANNE|nr:DgyrCDS7388 [Dimorphilus gyrociliatus]
MSTEVQIEAATEREYYMQKISRLLIEIKEIQNRNEDEEFRKNYFNTTGDQIEPPEQTALRLSKLIDQKKDSRDYIIRILQDQTKLLNKEVFELEAKPEEKISDTVEISEKRYGKSRRGKGFGRY